jgi:hypothetical protein
MLRGRAAWTTSRPRPAFLTAAGRTRCRRDLERHERDFAERAGFTYTVLSQDDGDVIGCVYIYPQRTQGSDRRLRPGHADVSSWVRADRADLDPVLYDAVRAWLERDWPFTSFDYAPPELTGPPGRAPMRVAAVEL